MLRGIADRFYRTNINGKPLCICSLEDYICVGSTDGSIRLFDNQEQEIRTLVDKSVKGIPVTCIDMKRVDKNQNIFVVAGNSKGNLVLYEIKGLAQQWQLPS